MRGKLVEVMDLAVAWMALENAHREKLTALDKRGRDDEEVSESLEGNNSATPPHQKVLHILSISVFEYGWGLREFVIL